MATDLLSLEEAAAELAKAKRHYEALSERLKNGTEPIPTQEELVEAQDRIVYLSQLHEGAKKAEERRRVQERREEGERLHADFREQATAKLVETEEAMTDLASSLTTAINAVEDLNALREGYQVRWNDLFRGATDDPVALKFKSNGAPGGQFGALTPHDVLGRQDILEMVAAIAGESVKGRQRSSFSGRDIPFYDSWRRPQIASGLRDLRALIQRVLGGSDDK